MKYEWQMPLLKPAEAKSFNWKCQEKSQEKWLEVVVCAPTNADGMKILSFIAMDKDAMLPFIKVKKWTLFESTKDRKSQIN